MMLEMASRNGMRDEVPFKSEEEAEAMFNYDNLQQFLDLRDASLQVRTSYRICQELAGYADLPLKMAIQSIRMQMSKPVQSVCTLIFANCMIANTT